jgi:Flp pilus assembly pilin Flp
MDTQLIQVFVTHFVRQSVGPIVCRKLGNERGATLVEYVVLMVAVMLLCVAAFKSLAQKIGTGAANAGAQL